MTTEQTDLGEQHLIPGIEPIPLRDRLQLLATLPVLPRARQRPCDIGLFDMVGRAQLDLFIHTKG